MIRVNILCEGATEEKFVKDILYPHFLHKGILLTPRGLDGGNNYGKIKYNIVEWLNTDKTAYVTTMIDLYGMNEDFPGYDLNKSPEHINDNKYTAPSKRILKIAPFYDKINDGCLITADIGLAALRTKCKHFDDWITILENLE